MALKPTLQDPDFKSPHFTPDKSIPIGQQLQAQKERRDRGIALAIREGLKGSLYGFLGSMSINELARRYSKTYAAVTLPGKVMFIAIASIGTGIIVSEHAIYRFNRPFLYIENNRLPAAMPRSMWERVWAFRLQIIAAASLGTIAGAMVILDRKTPGLTWTQKMMNARLWGQAVGLGGVCAAMATGRYAFHPSNKPQRP